MGISLAALNIFIIKGDFIKKNFASKNLVFLLFVLEHIKDDKCFIKKISKLSLGSSVVEHFPEEEVAGCAIHPPGTKTKFL
jgi:hypothetical protein